MIGYPFRRYRVQIRSEAKKIRCPLACLKKSAVKILKILGLKNAGLSILLLDDAGIRKLNRKYLRHDRPTDVISFPPSSLRAPKGRSNLANARLLRRPNGLLAMTESCFLGDVAISLETAKRAAKELKTSFDYEVHLYLCHGILHLTGCRDKTPQARKKMWREQNTILNQLGITNKLVIASEAKQSRF